MRHRWPGLTLLIVSIASPAAAQAPVYQTGGRTGFKFSLEGLFRQEWNQDEPSFQEESRWRLRLLPRLQIGQGGIWLGVGGDFNYSQDRNTEPPEGTTTLPLIRDNYDSRDARLDLAYLRIEPVSWLELEGGRFEMPVGFTEMIWDHDLRPQGGAITVRSRDQAGVSRFALTGLWARGSHVFDDGKTTMWVGSAEAVLSSTRTSQFTVTGSFVKFTDVNELAVPIRRQNSRVGGLLVRDYEVVDLVARARSEGRVTTQFVAEYCRNTAADDGNKGLWLAFVLGSTKTARGRLEYVYAKVDRDATLAAYNTDDFFWGTGWEGHRVDLGVRSSSTSSLHVVGELSRFKDSPQPAEQDIWAKRLRVELRFQ